MTCAELLTELHALRLITASRLKDIKTSLRYVAAALGAGTPERCPAATLGRQDPHWEDALEAHFRTLEAQGTFVSAYTRRNTRNNLRTVVRLADDRGLLAAPPPPPVPAVPPRRAFEAQAQATAPYQPTYRPQTGPRRYGLPPAQWPPDIQAGWQAYQARCGMRLRETSFATHAKSMATYLGYLINIQQRTVTWEDLFDLTNVQQFLRWHGARLQRSISVHGKSVVIMLAAIAVVLEHPNRRALADFRNGLPIPTPLHSKRAHWVSLATLERIAQACLTEGRLPYIVRGRDQYPGLRRATQFQRGLMLALLVRVPLRQRNVRELRLGQNLYQDQAGHWQLTFSGSELKIGTRRGRANAYQVDLTDYCPNFLPLLEEFLATYRPRLPKAQASTHLFLTWHGTPFTQRSLAGELGSIVARHTGQRFYPHLLRTIWATEFLSKKEDFTTAATMLGDTLRTVMTTYYDIVHKDQHAKARDFLSETLREG
jgi:hypothetical protein